MQFGSGLGGRYRLPLPGFNGCIYQEGHGGLGSIFSALSRVLLPATQFIAPNVFRGVAQILGEKIAEQATKRFTNRKRRIESENNDTGTFDQTGGGKPRRKRFRKQHTTVRSVGRAPKRRRRRRKKITSTAQRMKRRKRSAAKRTLVKKYKRKRGRAKNSRIISKQRRIHAPPSPRGNKRKQIFGDPAKIFG